jgi:hypothetical protein
VTAVDQATLIRKSLTIFVCGLIGALPILGLVPGTFALVSALRIHFSSRQTWNPASRYLRVGAALALVGIGVSALIIAAAIIAS